MRPFTRSIVELFDGKKRYLIPLYQRQYAWRVDPQLELLWEDIERAARRLELDRRSLHPHFMGAIVIAQVKTFGKEVQAFEIIDGQQRLTTFQLLLAALRDIACAAGSKYADELQKYLLNDGVMKDPETERFKLWPSLMDRRAFVCLIDPIADVDIISPKPVGEDGFVKRAVAAHAYFKSAIQDHVHDADGTFDEHRLEMLFEALKEGLAVVSIELEGGDDPQTIFETLNSRGVDLAPGDLMRNFIFQRAKGMGQESGSLLVDKLYEKHWLPLDQMFWNLPASRGRQSRQRLDWMLTDHLSMHVGDLVSVEKLFDGYRRWILNERPFSTVDVELESITATAMVEQKLFEQKNDDPIGDFGRFADAFDVSTAMPLVIYLATEADIADELPRALNIVKSYILRRDICGLTTKNYNRLFVGIIPRLRETDRNKVDALFRYLSARQADSDRWPDDVEWYRAWIGREQYKGPRQARLRYLLEAIEKAMRTALNEDIEIKSALTIEHIMPQNWRLSWPIPGTGDPDDDFDPELLARQAERSSAVNRLGNLTMLTQSLNSTVSNGPFSTKMPAVRAHSSLALNRALNQYEDWNEDIIAERGKALFNLARPLWSAPDRSETTMTVASATTRPFEQRGPLPPHGTKCRFTYASEIYLGNVEDGVLMVNGIDGIFSSFSAASKAITQTNRNGWNDWYLFTGNGWLLAADWRAQQQVEDN